MTHTFSHVAPERHRRFPAVPEPQPTIQSLVQVCNALKETVELLTNQRKRDQGLIAAPTWNELINMGVVTVDQVVALQDGRVIDH